MAAKANENNRSVISMWKVVISISNNEMAIMKIMKWRRKKSEIQW